MTRPIRAGGLLSALLAVAILLMPFARSGADVQPADGTVRVDVSGPPVALGSESWDVDTSTAESDWGDVSATPIPASVTRWDPVARTMTLRVGMALTRGSLSDARMVVDWVSPSYEPIIAPDGVFLAATCAPRDLGPRLDLIVAQNDGYGPRYGDCFDVGVVAEGQTVWADVPLVVGVPTSRFRLVYHLEDADRRYRLGLKPAPPPANGKLQPPEEGAYLGAGDGWANVAVRSSRYAAKYGSAPAFIFDIRSMSKALTAEALGAVAVETNRLGSVAAFFIGIPVQPGGARSADELTDDCGGMTWQKALSGACGGMYEKRFRAFAQTLRDAGVPVLLTTSAEGTREFMAGAYGPGGDRQYGGFDWDGQRNQYGDPTVPDGPERYRDFHRWVVDIFNEEGATNIAWAMMFNPADWVCTGGDDGGDGDVGGICQRYVYPGDTYVDWIGSYFQTSAYGDTDHREFGYARWQSEQPDKPAWGYDEHLTLLHEPVAQQPRLDRSAVFSDLLFRVFPEQYPNWRAAGWWEEAGDSPLWYVYGSADPGFFHMREADVFREAFGSGYWISRPVVATGDAPARTMDLAFDLSTATLQWSAPEGAISYDVRCRADDAHWSAPGFSRLTVSGSAAAGEIVQIGVGSASGSCALTSTNAANQTSPVSNVVTVPA